jgi:cobalamin transport system substrate-binding protein
VHRRLVPLLLVVSFAIASAACGSSSKPAAVPSTRAAQTESARFPVTVKTANGSVTIPTRPTRIVSLSPTATEMLFAIGAGSQVNAVDDQSNYPANAPKTKLSGYQPNVEAIAGYNPDLVVIDDGAIVPELNKLKITALVDPAATTLADSYAQIEQLGAATGHQAQAATLVTSMKTKIAKLQAQVPADATPLTYYYELDNTFYTVTSKTFIGQLFSIAKLRNIADAADTKGSGYPQLSAEYIVQQNPNLVYLADTKCCHQSQQTVATRPGWNSMEAVKSNDVISLDDDIASRWGPRVVDLLQQVVTSAETVRAR